MMWTAQVEVDSDGQYVLVFPDELLDSKELDWKPGDTLKWTQIDNDTWTLSKHETSSTE